MEEARAKDVATREAHNKRANKDRRAKDKDYKINDQVLLAQRKTVVKPPFDPLPYTVEKVGRDQVTIKRGRKELVRNKAQLKLLTPRPERLKANRRIVFNPSFDMSEDENYDLEAIRRRYTSVVASGYMENHVQELKDDGTHITEQVPRNDIINAELNEMVEVEIEANGQVMESDESFQDASQNLNSPESVGREEEITPQKESYSDEERADSEDSEEESVEQLLLRKKRTVYFTSIRVGKNPGLFLNKTQPGGFFWVLLGFWGFIGFFWVLLSLDMLSLNIKFS